MIIRVRAFDEFARLRCFVVDDDGLRPVDPPGEEGVTPVRTDGVACGSSEPEDLCVLFRSGGGLMLWFARRGRLLRFDDVVAIELADGPGERGRTAVVRTASGESIHFAYETSLMRLPFDFTANADAEDFDFGLFLRNVHASADRRQLIFRDAP